MDHPYYTGKDLWILNVAIGLGTFVQVLDTSIANVAVPYIAGNLSVSADQGTWVITSFAASNAIVLPLTGWLSDYFGKVRLFVWSVLLFGLMSFCCAISTSLTMLVFFRVLQGAVAGSLIPLSQSLMVANSPDNKKGLALGVWGMVVIIAPILGPIVGGYLTDVYSWPWIFYVNLPVCLFSATITWFYLRDRESEILKNPIDWVGIFFLAVGVGTLQIMLDNGKDLDWFDSNVIIALTITSGVSLTYFVIWTIYQQFPIVDFSFFKKKSYVIGVLATTLGYAIYFGSSVILPLWLQTEQGYTAYWAGVSIAPIGIAAVVLSPIVGKYINRVDLRLMISLSFIILASSFFYQANFTTQVDLYTIMISRFAQGFGIAIFFLPLVQMTMAEVSAARYASASGLYHFIRILIGSGFGTSLIIELWTRLEIFHHARLTESVTIYRSVTTQMYESLSDYSSKFTPDVINRIFDTGVEQQAFMLATNDISWLAAWLLLMIIPVILFSDGHVKSKEAQISAVE